MTSTGWAIVALVMIVTLLLTIAIAVFAWRLLARYVNFVLQAPKWLVVVCFLLFPPAFIAFLVGLIPYSQLVARADKEFSDGLTVFMWKQYPPATHIKGDEKTRREIALKRRALGYDLPDS